MQYFLRDSLQDMLFGINVHKALWLLRGMAPCRASARSVVSVWSGIAWGAVGHCVVFCLRPYSPALLLALTRAQGTVHYHMPAGSSVAGAHVTGKHDEPGNGA